MAKGETMAIESLETTIESLRTRARRLELEAAELRAEMDEIAVLLTWRLEHSISARALEQIPVSDAELGQYRAMLTANYPEPVLRLVIQAQKIASQIKRSLPLSERREAIATLIGAFDAAAHEQHLQIPEELEAVIGD